MIHKTIIGVAPQRPTPVPESPPPRSVDPWVVLLMLASSAGTYIATQAPKLFSSPLFAKVAQTAIADHHAKTSIEVATELTQNNLQIQQTEAKIDERQDLIDLLKQVLLETQKGTNEQQSQILTLFGQMMALQATHAKAAESQSAIAARLETIATAIAESITILNLSSARSQKETTEILKKVADGQEITHEYLASLAGELRVKLAGIEKTIVDAINAKK